MHARVTHTYWEVTLRRASFYLSVLAIMSAVLFIVSAASGRLFHELFVLFLLLLTVAEVLAFKRRRSEDR